MSECDETAWCCTLGRFAFAYFWKCMEQLGKVGDTVLHAGGTTKGSSMGST